MRSNIDAENNIDIQKLRYGDVHGENMINHRPKAIRMGITNFFITRLK